MRKKRIFAICRRPDGSLVKKEIVRKRDTYKRYDNYVKDVESGLFLKPHLKQTKINLDKNK